MIKKKVLITGASGFLGQRLIQKFKAGELLGIYNSQKPLVSSQEILLIQSDLSLPTKEVLLRIKDFKPEVIIHTAAFTNVDECERNPSLAKALNVTMTQNVVQIAAETNAHLIHISTDQIFDGKESFYPENAKPTPVNEYGRTKLEAEEVAKAWQRSTILRTNFYGLSERGASFLNWLEASIRNDHSCTFFQDVFYTPIYIDDLVEVIRLVAGKTIYGILNVTGNERVSKAEFALKVIEILKKDFSNYKLADYEQIPGQALRPLEMSLSNEKLKSTLGFQPVTIKIALKDLFKR